MLRICVDKKYRSAVGGPFEIAARRLGAEISNQPSFRTPPADLPVGWREKGTMRRKTEVLLRLYEDPDNVNVVGVVAEDAIALEAVILAEIRLAAWSCHATTVSAVHADGRMHILIRRRNTLPIIRAIIERGQEPRIEVDGCKGPQCHTLTEDLVKRLGQAVGSEDTPELYETECGTERQLQST